MGANLEHGRPMQQVNKNQVLITLTREGQVMVQGDLANKIFCMGMLEMAKTAVLNFDPGAVFPASGNLLVPKTNGAG